MSLDICYVIAHGFSLRMVLHSKVVPQLRARGLRVGVITPNAEETSLIELAAELGIQVFPVVGVQQAGHTWLRPFLTEDLRQHFPLRMKLEGMKNTRKNTFGAFCSITYYSSSTSLPFGSNPSPRLSYVKSSAA